MSLFGFPLGSPGAQIQQPQQCSSEVLCLDGWDLAAKWLEEQTCF